MNEVLVGDIETNGLLDKVDLKLHMVQIGTLAGEDATVYGDHDLCDAPLKEGLERLRDCEKAYFHNGLDFDYRALVRLAPGTLRREQLVDTLIMARMAFPHRHRHSLESFGADSGSYKSTYDGDYSEITQDFVDYSRQDIHAGRALARLLIKELQGQDEAIAVEHAVAWWIRKQEATGFHLDVEKAERLYLDLLATKQETERDLKALFPSRWVSRGSVISRANNSKFGYTKGSEFTRVEWEEFEPGSRVKAANRLVDAGWKPKKFNARGPELDDDVLEALSLRYPAAAKLRTYYEVEKQVAEIGGNNGWLKKVTPAGTVHGRVNTVGAYTIRMSHSGPNMAKIPKADGFRDCWIPRPGWWLVGCDGEGIQARGMAHYLHTWDGGNYTKIITTGSKDDRTDIHSLNASAIEREAGWPKDMGWGDRRDTSKNCNYAIYFGAQDPRLGQTYKDGVIRAGLKPPRVPNRELGTAIRRGISHNMIGLFTPTKTRSRSLVGLVEETFEKQGFIRGLDGRKLFPPSKRNALVTLIQSFEAIVMKHALVIWADEVAPGLHLEYGRDWEMVANVHDEIQFQCPTEDLAKRVGEAFGNCITMAGERLGSKCPLAGSWAVGKNWHETH